MRDIFRRFLGGGPRDQAEPAEASRETDHFPPPPPAPPVIEVEQPPAAPEPAPGQPLAPRRDRSIASALLVAGSSESTDAKAEAEAYLRWRRMRARIEKSDSPETRTDDPAPDARNE